MSSTISIGEKQNEAFAVSTSKRNIKIGFVPMSDCAPLIAAKELGYFDKRGLRVELSREVGWATVRERMSHGELDGSHAHASMVFELGCGLGGRAVPCLTGMMISHNGSAISFSNELFALGVRDARSLKEVVDAHRGERRFKFAVVLKFSTQNYLLRKWLRRGGIEPDVDVDILIVPPPHVFACLMQGHIDGYCAGEPWSSIGLIEEVCWCAALSGEVEDMHPEKVLLVHQDFEDHRHDEHVAMIAALLEAAEFCDKLGHREELAEILAQPHYFNVSREALLNGLQGPFQRGMGQQSSARDSIVFYRDNANAPTTAKARWVLDEMTVNDLGAPSPGLTDEEIKRFFRMDLFEEAQGRLKAA